MLGPGKKIYVAVAILLPLKKEGELSRLGWKMDPWY